MTDAKPTRPRLALTMGDPNGIGPEILLGCLGMKQLREQFAPIVVGSAGVLCAHADRLGRACPPLQAAREAPAELPEAAVTVLEVTEDAPEVAFGQVTREGGRLAMQAVEAATTLCIEGQADALVTAPLSKEAIAKAGYQYPGHTEFIAERTGAKSHTMMMVAEGASDLTEAPLRVGLVTAHVALADVPQHLSREAILSKLRIVSASLKQDFGDAAARIAVLGLNPHAGDGGVMGKEEGEIIRPAVDQALQEGLQAAGPFPADGFFGLRKYRDFGAVLAMYHDQGLVPFKALAFDRGVNYTAGLSIVRTSPDHGTAYDIAGMGRADLGSMQSAIELALAVARRRSRRGGSHEQAE